MSSEPSRGVYLHSCNRFPDAKTPALIHTLAISYKPATEACKKASSQSPQMEPAIHIDDFAGREGKGPAGNRCHRPSYVLGSSPPLDRS